MLDYSQNKANVQIGLTPGSSGLGKVKAFLIPYWTKQSWTKVAKFLGGD